MLQTICNDIGKIMLEGCANAGRMMLLFTDTLKRIGQADWKETVRQMAKLGADSLPIVLMTILFTGMVFSVQTAKEFVRFGASSSVGGIVAIAMGRELVPVLTGVVVAGRIGAAIAAEIGTMKADRCLKSDGYQSYDLSGRAQISGHRFYDAGADRFCQYHWQYWRLASFTLLCGD